MAIIDEEKLKELKELSGGNDELLKILLDKYISNSESFLVQIKDAIANNDREKIQFAVHTLKGSSLSLGLSKLGAIFSDLNARAKKGDFENFSAQIPVIENLLSDVNEYRKSL